MWCGITLTQHDTLVPAILFTLYHHIGLFCSAACSRNVTAFPTTIALLLDCGERGFVLLWPIKSVNTWRLGTLGRLCQQIFICSCPNSEALYQLPPQTMLLSWLPLGLGPVVGCAVYPCGLCRTLAYHVTCHLVPHYTDSILQLA